MGYPQNVLKGWGINKRTKWQVSVSHGRMYRKHISDQGNHENGCPKDEGTLVCLRNRKKNSEAK